MKKQNIILGLIISVIIFLIYGYFIDTLRLSEITGKTNNVFADMLLNFVDFDTGLTRYDIHKLKSKSPYWQKRIHEVMSIKDTHKRNKEEEVLMEEMMIDPTLSKIAEKSLGINMNAVLSILRATK